METITLNNVEYTKASVIAKDLGYTSDYIGQLCRAGKVDAQLVGRSWYVAKDSIHSHKKNKQRSNQAKSHAAVAEYKKRAPQHSTQPVHVRIHSYESDDTELFPAVAKKESVEPDQTVASVKVKPQKKSTHFSPAPPSTVRFAGSVAVASADDQTDEPLYVDGTPAVSVKKPAPRVGMVKPPAQNRIMVQTEEVEAGAPVLITRPSTQIKRKRRSVLSIAIRLVTYTCLFVLISLIAASIEQVNIVTDGFERTQYTIDIWTTITNIAEYI